MKPILDLSKSILKNSFAPTVLFVGGLIKVKIAVIFWCMRSFELNGMCMSFLLTLLQALSNRLLGTADWSRHPTACGKTIWVDYRGQVEDD